MCELLAGATLRTVAYDVVTPCDPRRVGPNSVDVTLAPRLLRPDILSQGAHLDLRTDHPADLLLPHDLTDVECSFGPGAFALGATVERICVPADMVGFVQGRSTFARAGLQIESAGLLDSGFEGTVTLEIVNLGPWRIDLWAGMPIAQVWFVRLGAPVDRPYTGRYQFQDAATAAKVLP